MVNQGTRTITRVQAQFSPDGQMLIGPRDTEYLPASPSSWKALPGDTIGYHRVLIRGSGMVFISEAMPAQQIAEPFAVVERTDWRGTTLGAPQGRGTATRRCWLVPRWPQAGRGS